MKSLLLFNLIQDFLELRHSNLQYDDDDIVTINKYQDDNDCGLLMLELLNGLGEGPNQFYGTIDLVGKLYYFAICRRSADTRQILGVIPLR